MRDYLGDVLPPSFYEMADLLARRRISVLTGAGCSTESGIPDYRGPGTRERRRRPVLYQKFVRDAAARRRYWARSAIGWARVARARPNPAHVALARLEGAGLVCGTITQNVDGLHRAAGSRRVVELHGSLAWVRCLGCGARESRASVQERLMALNPAWAVDGPRPMPRREAALAPDGDAELPEEAISDFRVPACRTCGGVLKPDVVFFGENVPPPRVAEARQTVERGEVLLVIGSSLSVYSGYRFVLRARERGRPVAIVNLGPTRGDPDARVRVRGRAGEVLPLLADELLESIARPYAADPGIARPYAADPSIARPYIAAPGTAGPSITDL